MSPITTPEADDDWPQSPEEMASQLRPVLEMFARHAKGLGMITTAQMLQHVAKAAEQEARPDRGLL